MNLVVLAVIGMILVPKFLSYRQSVSARCEMRIIWSHQSSAPQFPSSVHVFPEITAQTLSSIATLSPTSSKKPDTETQIVTRYQHFRTRATSFQGLDGLRPLLLRDDRRARATNHKRQNRGVVRLRSKGKNTAKAQATPVHTSCQLTSHEAGSTNAKAIGE